MKKMINLMICSLFLLLLAGCGKEQDRIMLENASPETSAMSFYYFDGETTTIKWLYDSAKEQRIIDEINKLKTKAVDSAKIADFRIPCYGLEIVDKVGYEIWLTYNEGLWLLKDGAVYEAEYDFAALYDNIPDADAETCNGGIRMLNSAILGRYDVRYYAKSENLTSTKDGISISFVSFENNIVTVKLQNDTDNEFFYGEYFTLQKEINGEWYTLPVRLSNYGFTDIGIILRANQSTEEKCDLTMYGELESGHYRIEKEGMAAAFYIE